MRARHGPILPPKAQTAAISFPPALGARLSQPPIILWAQKISVQRYATTNVGVEHMQAGGVMSIRLPLACP